jgi:hypothetical protein
MLSAASRRAASPCPSRAFLTERYRELAYVEVLTGDTECFLRGEPGLGGQGPGYATSEPVQDDQSAGESIALEAGHARRAELGDRDDDEVKLGGTVAGELGEARCRAVGDDDIQVMVGVPGDHALLGLGALEDKADHGGVGGCEGNECVIAERLTSGHCLISG